MFEDRRKSQRQPIGRAVELFSMDDNPKQLGGGRLVNLSTTGACIESTTGMAEGTQVKAVFTLDERSGFWMISKIIRVEQIGNKFRIGMNFLNSTLFDKEKIRAHFKRLKRAAEDRMGYIG